MIKRIVLITIYCLAIAMPSGAQDKGTLASETMPPLAEPNAEPVIAKEFFGRVKLPNALPNDSVGFYAKGCLSGAVPLPLTGPTWQVMRPSRNRNWAHQSMIDFIQRHSRLIAEQTDWPGLLIGDISQARGGPMLGGHASHQTGLDVDIWYMPMPNKTLTTATRETLSANNLVANDGLSVNAETWSESHRRVLQNAAQQPEVQRIFVNAAIKKKICESHKGEAWLGKIRPYYGHDDHYHVRLFCPKDANQCTAQDPISEGNGCDESLQAWFTDEMLHPKFGPAKPPLLMTDLPVQCQIP